MIDLLPLSIGIGLVVSLLFSEIFGLAAGGLVVPGYIALHLNRPIEVALTILVGLATFVVVRSLSTIMIIYGRRRTVLMVLVGYLLGMWTSYTAAWVGVRELMVSSSGHAVIGYIIPGLIAMWLDRQGLVETLSVLFTASVVVRLVLVLTIGAELLS